MALQKQTVRMSVVDGLDTKTDEKNVVATRFLEADNVVYTKTGSVSKRFGCDRLSKHVLNNDDLTSANAIATFKSELLTYSTNSLYSFSEGLDKFVNKGSVPFALAETEPIVNTGVLLEYTYMALIENLACYTYASASQSEWAILDNNTGVVIASGTLPGVLYPRVVAVQGRFFIFGKDGASLKVWTINSGTPTIISSATAVAAMSTNSFDVTSIGLRAYFMTPTAGGMYIGWVDVDSVIHGPVTMASTAWGGGGLSISEENTGQVRIVYDTTTPAIITTVYNADLNAQLHVPSTLALAVTPRFISAVQDPTTATASIVYYSRLAVGTTPAKVQKFQVTNTGTLSSETTVMTAALLQSKAQSYNNKTYVAISHSVDVSTNSNDTLYLLSEDSEFLAKFEQGQYPRIVNNPNFPTALLSSGTKLIMAVTGLAEFQPAGATTYVATTVKRCSADFSAVNNYFDTEIGENLHIAGGILKMYDGNSVVEHGFLDVPDAPIFVSETTFGATLQPGSYQYILVFAWNDKGGQRHRSAPSTPYTYEISGAPKLPTIRLNCCHFTQKDGVELEVYRTEKDGVTFYKHKEGPSDIIFNDKSVAYVTFSDTMDDFDLIRNEVLYTTGGTLDNISAGSCKYVTSYKSRIFTIQSDGESLQYSKIREQNGPIEFNDALTIKLDPRGGKAVALAVMDDHVVIFKETAIYTMSGEGPNNLGEQDDFRQPFLVTSDAGCVDPNSIATSPNGIMFKSKKGIYLLGRDMGATYIGAPVEAYNNLTITSATLVPKTNQVRFTTDSTKALVYDYFHQRWSTFSNINAIDATIYNDKYVFARSSGDIMVESTGFTDAGSFIPMALSSAWISLAGIQGFERFYKMLLLGSYKSSCKFKVSFAYDFDASFTSEVIIDAASILATPVYGEGAYGEESPYGGTDPLFQWRIFPKRQKCETFRFKIEDINNGVPGESFSLSNFAAEIGLKPSLYKRGTAYSAGTT